MPKRIRIRQIPPYSGPRIGVVPGRKGSGTMSEEHQKWDYCKDCFNNDCEMLCMSCDGKIFKVVSKKERKECFEYHEKRLLV